MKAWAVWRQLTRAQRKTLFLALVLLPLFALLLRRTSLARWLALSDAGDAAGPDAVQDALAAGRAVNLVANRLRATCLTRSVVLHRILSSRGIATELKIGVRNADDGLHAHAWVECDGVPVNDTAHGLRGFAALDRA